MASTDAATSRAGDLVAAAWRAVAPPDPGEIRLFGAVRTTLTGIAAWVMVLAVGAFVPIPSRAMFLAISSALSATAFVRDVTLPAQLITLAAAAPAGVAGLVIGILAAQSVVAAPCMMVVLIFLAVYAPEFGPRWPVLGLAALSGFIFALLTHPPMAELPQWLLALCVGAASSCVVRVCLQDRPALILTRLERSIRASISRLLVRVDLVIGQGFWRPADRRAVRQEIDLLNAATLMAESTAAAPELAGHGPAAALHFFAMELVTERFARQAQAALPPADERAALQRDMERVRQVLQGGRVSGSRTGDSSLAVLLDNLSTAVTTLPRDELRDVPAADSVTKSAAATARNRLASPVLHHALQASLASGLAIAGGDLLAPQRWYWGAMTAYVLFQGIRSRADSLVKAVQALVGTLAGALAGLVLASLLAGHQVPLIIAIFIGVFLAYQASQAAYAVMNFWLTICLGLLFGLLGAFSIDVLLTRFVEAMIGAAAGILTAWAFLGTSSAAVARKAACDLLAALLAVVQAASHAALAGKPEPGLVGMAVTLHARLGDLVTITRPRMYGLATLADHSLRRQVVALTFCANWGRELALSALQCATPPSPAVGDMMRSSAARIEVSVAMLSRLLIAPANATPAAEKLPSDPPAAAGLPPADTPITPSHIARLLLRIDAALVQAIRRAHGEP